MNATLILENGQTFVGESFGDTADKVFQLVFYTATVGYQEVLTDPTSAGQGIVVSFPLVGNYGVNEEDCQSDKTWASALIVRNLSKRGSNFRCEGNLDSFLKLHHVAGIQGIDTRALTKILRTQGSMRAMITCAEHFNIEDAINAIKSHTHSGTPYLVSCKAPVVHPACGAEKFHVAVLDYGVKKTTIESLTYAGCKVTVLPCQTKAQEILNGRYDGVYLSEGPGFATEFSDLVSQITLLYQSSLPIFAAGLGHQMLALAAGGKVVSFAGGHRGTSYPVLECEKNKILTTAQNHGFVVEEGSLSAEIADITHRSMDDGSIEGLSYTRGGCFSVQFSPAITLSAQRKEGLVARFLSEMEVNKHAKK